ncbi:LOW QUALITY PROTEIN: protein ALTERED PHOSPHATE STARVATION RESPONSE 1 [Raphanus sativus]|uniref:LOW QUALITY PROTEIN: protein ALTERED PHOSPHATE STARVATION RESPONSE 1 n=1 Tax=Raphanus sativus TaxID=3726 RepID=A0A6J0MF28_RAPSA|nr:LOW QUALITY PROTEIN: protein ALTERED PHOSPHATE STARVATION RESPONSE 1 [Raphanus sativus]
MGCTSSKLDDLPAVALCRDRCAFLDAAIQQRYQLSDSHVAYTNSLRGIGHSLHLFINHHHRFVSSGGANGGGGGGGDSPRLNLPPQRKGDPDEEEEEKSPPKKAKLPSSHQNHSGSGSDSGHLEFDSDSDSDDDDDDEEGHLDLDSDSLHHLSPQPPQHHLGHFPIQHESGPYMAQQPYPNPEMMGHHQLPYSGGSYMHMNYMKNKSMPPSVIFEQRPSSPQRVYEGESSSSSSNYPYNNPYPPPNSYYGYSNNPGPGPGYYGSSSSGGTTSKPPPPPPSPPRSNGWDFLNPFDTYYPPYTPSRDSRELREEEGIPELEEDDSGYEVVKEVHGRPKFAVPGGGINNQPPPAAVYREEEPPLIPSQPHPPSVADKSGASTSGGGDAADAAMYQSRPSSVSVEKKGVEYEVHVVEKTVVEDAGNEERRSNAAGTRGGGGGGGVGGGPRAVHEVAKEIENQFVKAAESGSEIAKLLEVGKHPYGRKHAASKLLHGVTPSLPSTSGGGSSSAAASTAPPTYADIEEELASRSRNLSSTLHKLHLWEKKLYHEVKAEEKLRVAHEKKLRKLKRLDERGAEATKVDTTRKLVRDMSTKIRIAIQVVDKISVTINKIRDEDLWPQLNALIQGLTRMWKAMFECHQSQCQAIREARGLGPIRASKKLGEEHLEATSLLGHELINWILGFSNWVSAQKGYVRELNKWLMKCLLYEPEETPDGIAPFSPGRIGAPPIFVICNQWSQALDRISEKEVIEAMRSFTTSVLQLWEQDRLETTTMGHGDSEKRVRNMDREEQKIHREIQALEKKMVLVAPGDGTNSLSLSGNVVYQSDTSNESLQGSLQRIFEAMERFTAESVRAYDDLLVRAEEETAPRELEEDDEE